MESVSIESIAQQVGKLADDLRKQIEPVTKEIDGLLPSQLCATTSFVYLTGDGDSYHAACAAEMAFESLAGLSCEPISALRFLEYTTPWMSVTSAAPPLVVAISASGKTQRVVQAVEAGRRRRALTIAVTGTPGGPVARAADHSLVIDLARRERSPGICTYQASLLGLVLIAIRLGEARRYRTQSECSALRQELLALPRMIEATVEVIEDRCRSVAAMVADSPLLVMVGSGPNYGTALFSAAKMAEAAGVFAAGQDLEEWCHRVPGLPRGHAGIRYCAARPVPMASCRARCYRPPPRTTRDSGRRRCGHRSRHRLLRPPANSRARTRGILAVALPCFRWLPGILPGRTFAPNAIPDRAPSMVITRGRFPYQLSLVDGRRLATKKHH